ncbi:MAG: STN domain-containing protein [Candidatus Brocadiia bacterium]
MSYRKWAVLACFIVLWGHGVAADTITLSDGTVLQGAAAVKADRVTIETSTGTLTLPAWRVESIEGEPTGAARPEPQPGRNATGKGRAPEGRLTIKAENVPLAQLLAQISKKTGADIRAVSDLRESETRVTADLQDVPVDEALRRVLEGTEYRLRVRPGGVFEVRRPPAEPEATVAEVLERRIDVDFDGIPLSDMLSYIQEVTGVNMVVSNEVRRSPEPVYLRMRNVSVETVLELALEPHGFDYAVRPGQILFVGEEGEVHKHVFRVYPVTDLLLNRGAPAAPGGAGLPGTRGTAGGGGGGGLNPQFAPAPSGGQAFIRGGAAGDGGAAAPMVRRAGDLVLLIKQTCGRNTWREANAPGLVGGTTPTGR